MYKNSAVFEKCQQISLFQWSEIWHRRLYSLDVKTLIVLDTSAKAITVQRSPIPHRYDWLFFCFTDKLGKAMWSGTTIASRSVQF